MNHARIFNHNLPAVGGQQHQKGKAEGMPVPERAKAAFFPGTAQPFRQRPERVKKPQGHARPDDQAFQNLKAVLPQKADGFSRPHGRAQKRHAAQKGAEQIFACLRARRAAKQITPGQPKRHHQYAGCGQRLRLKRGGGSTDQLIQKAARIRRIRLQLSGDSHIQTRSERHQQRCQRRRTRSGRPLCFFQKRFPPCLRCFTRLL